MIKVGTNVSLNDAELELVKKAADYIRTEPDKRAIFTFNEQEVKIANNMYLDLLGI